MTVTARGGLRLTGVSKFFKGAVTVQALTSVTVAVEPGQSVGIVGSSGSGKSTMLNILGLLDRPSDGTYEVDGVDTGSLTESERTGLRAHAFGFVFQAFQLMESRDVLSNVELGMMYRGIPAARRKTLSVQALERVGLSHRRHVRAGTLSGGEKQRAAIARAVASSPGVLLCDEPTGNLDSANAEAILSLLLDLQREGTTLVVVTHDPAVAGRMERRLHVKDGVVST